MDKKMFWVFGNSVGSIIGFCFRFAWDSPIIFFQLFCVGFLTVLYPQFCFKVYLNPVVVYTAFFLTALLRIGHTQQQEKVAAFERKKVTEEANKEEEKPIDKASHMRRLAKEFNTERVEYVEDRIISEVEQEGELDDGSVDSKEIYCREAEIDQFYGNRSMDLLNDVLVPDFQNDQCYTKSVHFSDSLIEGMYRTQLDVIMEEENEEEEHSHAEDFTHQKIDTDSDDEALMSVSPQFENREHQHQRKVRLEEFFSLTLHCESRWKSFGRNGGDNNSCSSDEEDDDDTDSSGSSHASMGQLGPLVYEHVPQQSNSIQSNLHAENSSVSCNGGGGEDSDSPVDFHFTWTEDDEGEEKENLFEIVHEMDAQSMSEEDNLIEIALSDQENPELQEIQRAIDHDRHDPEEQQGQVHQHKPKKFEGPEEENLIEIDLLTHNIGLPEEIEEKNQVQRELSDQVRDDPSVHKDPTDPLTELELEEMKASEQDEPSSPTELTGKTYLEIHPQDTEIGEPIESSAGSEKLTMGSEEK